MGRQGPGRVVMQRLQLRRRLARYAGSPAGRAQAGAERP